MSGGFFRGTSADQDTRFSNKAAKLLKTQKFASELDQLVDMGKINMDVMRPWIATRVTQLMGFEDEVLINFVYGLLEGKNVDGKQIQINLTGFMEKNTGKFMRELWGLLTSAQNGMNGIPQQFLDEKAEEIGRKKAEEQCMLAEIQRKEEAKKGAEQELLKKENYCKVGENVAVSTSINLNSLKGSKSPDCDRLEGKNGTTESRRLCSRSRSGSHTCNKSVSRSPRRRRLSRSLSRSPARLLQRSRSPRGRGGPPTFHRSKSPVRRARSPIRTLSPRRRRRSPAYSRSPRRRHRSPAYSRSSHGRSPVSAAGSPRKRHLPSYSPRGRSPVLHSPRRRRSPVYSRSSPRRRKSPPRTPPRYRGRSPVYDHSPPRRYLPASPPPRNRHTAASNKRHIELSPSPRRQPLVQLGHRVSSSLLRSLSPEAFSRSPRRRVSPCRQVSRSPHLRSLSPSVQEELNRGSPPVQQRPPTLEHLSSPGKVEKTVDNRSHGTLRHRAPERRRTPSPSLSPERRHTPHKSVEALLGNVKSMPIINKKRARSSSAESSLPDEDRQAAHVKKATVFDDSAAVLTTMNYQARKQAEPDQSVSKSSDDDRHMSPGVDQRSTKNVESDDNEEDYGSPLPLILDEREASKRRRKEEHRLRKEEKRRKRGKAEEEGVETCKQSFV